MTGEQRREQLVAVGRSVFADRGFDGTSVEEIAAQAGVSKPVVYEHFGGKEGLYGVVVDREMSLLVETVSGALTGGGPHDLLEQAALGLLDYVETSTDGFRVLLRDPPAPPAAHANLFGGVAGHLEEVVADGLSSHGIETRHAPMYARMLVGMAAVAGQWWIDAREADVDSAEKPEVAAHLVNLAWNGLSRLESHPAFPERQDDADPEPGARPPGLS